jgi:hypothetical protein
MWKNNTPTLRTVDYNESVKKSSVFWNITLCSPGKVWPARKADNLTAICEPTV